MSDLNSILSDEDLPEDEITEEAEAPEEDTDEGQDETEQQDEPEAEDEPKAKEDEPEKSVPLAALQAERDEKRELKRRLEMLESQYQQRNQPQQQPQQPPDIYEDPEARFQHERQQFQQELTTRTLKQSRFFAEREFGKDEVEATVEYFNQHPQESHQFLNEPSPFHAAVDYYRKQRKLAEIGDNPEEYEQKLRDKIRQELQAELVAENVKSAASAKAPSLAGKSNLGSRQGGEWQGPTPLNDILAG